VVAPLSVPHRIKAAKNTLSFTVKENSGRRALSGCSVIRLSINGGLKRSGER